MVTKILVVRKTAALVLAVALVAQTASPAWAQRRRAEPEANPQFQEELKSPDGGGGGPLREAPPEPAAAAPASEVSIEPAPEAPRSSVQIGAVAPPRAAEKPAGSPLETRVTVRVKGAPLSTFLDTISAQAKVNFIITEGLETKHVTAFLQNVTVREALQVLLEIKGLTYQQIGKSSTYVVSPRSREVKNYITRIYTLNYIPLIALPGSGELIAVPAGAGSSAGGTGMMGGGMPADTGGGSAPSQQSQGDSGVSIISVLRSVLSGGGQIAIEPRTNALVVTDVPEVFPQVEQIIAELDKKAPQVMIEAQIVEIDSSRARELGLEWGGPNGELGSFTSGARDTSFPLNMPRSLGDTKFFDPVNNVISGLGESKKSDATSAGANVTVPAGIFNSSLQTSVLDLTSLKVTLRALVARSEARFLGKPKILTLNNKSAIIAISANEAVGRGTTITGTAAASSSVSQAERVQTGLILKVTPQVNKEGYITMLVQPSFTDVKESNISLSNARVFDPIMRSASTLVRVRNAQTLVLGGLLRSTETKVVRKVPILGYIPIIGWFFTSSSTRRQNSDLVIFITPTIVSD